MLRGSPLWPVRAVNPPLVPPDLGGIVGCANKCSLRSRGMRALSNPNQPATRPIESQHEENLPDGVDFFGSKPYWFCATDIEVTFNLVTFIHLWYKMYKNERLPSKPHFSMLLPQRIAFSQLFMHCWLTIELTHKMAHVAVQYVSERRCNGCHGHSSLNNEK